MEKYLELEATLTNKIRRTRLLLVAITVLALVIGMVFVVLRENSKEVITPNTGYDIIDQGHQIITYHNNYLFGSLFGFLGAVSAGIFLIGHMVSARYDTVEVDGEYLTLYRGFGSPVLYLDGEEAARSSGYYLEATMKNRTKVTVSFSRGAYFAHMTFSNGRSPIDL